MDTFFILFSASIHVVPLICAIYTESLSDLSEFEVNLITPFFYIGHATYVYMSTIDTRNTFNCMLLVALVLLTEVINIINFGKGNVENIAMLIHLGFSTMMILWKTIARSSSFLNSEITIMPTYMTLAYSLAAIGGMMTMNPATDSYLVIVWVVIIGKLYINKHANTFEVIGLTVTVFLALISLFIYSLRIKNEEADGGSAYYFEHAELAASIIDNLMNLSLYACISGIMMKSYRRVETITAC